MLKKVFTSLIIIRLVLLLSLVSLPFTAQAGIFSTIFETLFNHPNNLSGVVLNSQNMPILESSRIIDGDYAKGGGDIIIVGGDALLPESGPSGTMVEITEGNDNGEISTYTVRSGDTLGSIAKMYGVSTNTIIWANDIKGSVIKVGQKLVILPISGVKYTVKKGDTLSGLAKKYKADLFEIISYNNLQTGAVLSVGDSVIIPGGKLSKNLAVKSITKSRLRGAYSVPSYNNYYLRPVVGGYRSQGLHGYNAVDIAIFWGAPIYASADGRVTVSREGGWNGGYGSYVVLNHSNNTQTLYAHMSRVIARSGVWVSKGDVIGYIGSTGKSTGPHIHFEVRGAKNPF